MHFVVAWYSPTRNDAAEQELKGVLKPYSWVTPFPSFYVVNINAQEQWQKILTDLQAVIKRFPQFSLILSPVMQGGRYDGILPEKIWPEVNARTN